MHNLSILCLVGAFSYILLLVPTSAGKLEERGVPAHPEGCADWSVSQCQGWLEDRSEYAKLIGRGGEEGYACNHYYPWGQPNGNMASYCPKTCNSGPCKVVNGGWSEYGEFSECKDNGEKTRTRKCDNPAPGEGGADCEGSDTETVKCVNGGWSDFSEYDNGIKTRTRTCDNPAPSNGGAECEGNATETIECPTEEVQDLSLCDFLKETNRCEKGTDDYKKYKLKKLCNKC